MVNPELIENIKNTVHSLNRLLAEASKHGNLMYEVSHTMRAWGNGETMHPNIRVTIGEVILDAERFG